ncbi:RNA polymerase sigma factor RpoH [Endothiovibrio diazotrophicus]
MAQSLILREHTLPLAVGSFERFVQAAHGVPMLSAEEEYSLAVRLRDSNDVEAAQRLILSHLRFVVRIARDYRGYGLQLADLVQQGTLGLMRAVRRFDPEQGVRLAGFAVHWIRAEIYEYVLRNWRIVKVATTKAQRKLFFNLHRMKKRLGWFTREQIEEVANDLGVKPEEVEEMEGRLSAHDQLFDARSLTDEDDADHRQSQSYLADLRFEPMEEVEQAQEEAWQSEALRAGMAELDERSRDILQRRWLDEEKATLHELAAEYGVSAERIRQIEAAAMKKLRKRFL